MTRLVFLLRAAVASIRQWKMRRRAHLLGTDLKESTRRFYRKLGAGFLCLYSDAEFQILLAELRYPRLRIGYRRD
jgi:hypothetical protein